MLTLMTGASGFIGRALTPRLIQDGHRVRIFCRSASRLDPLTQRSSAVDIVEGDMADAAAVRRAVRGANRVVHLAAATTGTWDESYKVTVLGTKYLLESAEEEATQRILYVSSMSVYDYSQVPDGGVVDERAPIEDGRERRNAYARAKGDADLVARQHQERGRVPICIARPGAVYGPGGHAPLLTTLLSLPGNVLSLIGGGRRQMPLVYISNLVDALLLVLERDQAFGRTFNIVDQSPPSEREYLKALYSMRGSTPHMLGVPRWPFLLAARVVQSYRDFRGRPGGMHLVHGFRRVSGQIRFDGSTALQALGWASRVTFGEGMRRTFGTPIDGASTTP